jgi:DNA polymerase
MYICNILKCRPPNNRDPEPIEIDTCEPYLWKQLEIIKPKLIVCLGRVAGQTLLRTTDSLNNLRGKVHNYRGMKLVVTYHPAALLRNPNWKKPTWEDVQWIRKMYDEMKAAGE